MAKKKYLSLDEAAFILRVEPIELQRMRERGEIRGYSDRGNWLFREEEVQELQRSREDSNPDVPIQWDAQNNIDESIFFDSDSDVKLASDEPVDLTHSDSDVRLVADESLGGPGSSSEVSIPMLGDSDSDVRLDAAPSKKEELDKTWGSDSEIRLDLGSLNSGAGSDSDVQLASDAKKPDSDSDVKLVKEQKSGADEDSDSDVKLTEEAVSDLSYSDSDVKLVKDETDEADVLLGDSDSDVRMVGDDFLDSDSDSDVKLTGSLAEIDETSAKSDDMLAATDAVMESMEIDLTGLDESSHSDVSMVDDKEYNMLDVDAPTVWAQDQKLPFESVEAVDKPQDDLSGDLPGIVDSGISLAGDGDSGIALDLGDSGIALDLGGDSGIALDLGGDSGIALDLEDDSGIKLSGPADSGIALEGPGESGFQQTVPQMTTYDGSEDTGSGRTHVEVPLLGEEDEYSLAADVDDTANSMPLIDDEDLVGVSDNSRTDGDLAVSIYDVEPSEEYAAELTDEGDAFGSSEVSEDVFDVGDEVFQGDMQTGSSSAEFDMPTAARKAPVVDADWGAGVNSALAFSTVLMALAGWVMFDLVRGMWASNEPSLVTGPLLDALRGFFS